MKAPGKYDIIILTDPRYLNPQEIDWYIENLLLEEGILREALEAKGLKVGRLNWDDPDFDWSSTRCVIFRSTWDYFERMSEFSHWLESTRRLTMMINSYETIKWNIDKHYLEDLRKRGIRIAPTLFIEPGERRSLLEISRSTGWSEIILKPAVSAGAWNTYRFKPEESNSYSDIFSRLLKSESILMQEFQDSVVHLGELALIVLGGKFSHAIMKKAKEGDFRVQDEFGGTIHDYEASREEIEFAEKVVSVCEPTPVYARVDIIRDTMNELCVSELELFEPELWFRRQPEAAVILAELVRSKITQVHPSV